MSQERISNRNTHEEEVIEQDEHTVRAIGQEALEAADALLDEIDDLLNEEDLTQYEQFIQKGGQ